jgi:signal transduction histidine kinase
MPKGPLPVASYLAAPVVSRSGDVLGGLFFGHERPGVFSERHEKILEGLAGQTAIALENARLFDQLQKSMAVKDEFLGLVSHELRTPITTILGNSILLERRAEKLPSDVKRDVYRDLTTEAERLERVIENLLLLTRVDVGEQPDMEPLRLQGLISDAIDALQRRSPDRKVVVESDGETPIALGVPEFAKLVLENLITNADKYSAGDKPIVIITRSDGEEQVEICVRDFGIGLDEEDVERVFTPFYRADGAKSRAKGIGLGLAVCKRVIEVQGGTIRAIARPEGGCDFVFNLNAYRTTGPDAD